MKRIIKKYFDNALARQLKKPRGIFGKVVAGKMTERNSSTYEWMLKNMDFSSCANILEIGYGAGKLLNVIAGKYPGAKIFGVDFSGVMYRKALLNNMPEISSGRMFLSQGDILEYEPPVLFDAIFAVNVIYFWDDLRKYLQKIKTLLQENGKVYIYMTDYKWLESLPATNTDVFNKRKVEEVLEVFKSCGYVECFSNSGEKDSKKGHCLIAVR